MTAVIDPIRFACRRRTEANFVSLNEVLLNSEIGVVTDKGHPRPFKIGDGTTAWNSLPYRTPLFAAASGTDTITVTFPVTPVLYDGMEVRIRAASANTGAATFNPNSLGALALTKHGGTALAAGDIAAAGHELLIVYRASVPRWELLNPRVDTTGGTSPVGAQLGYKYTPFTTPTTISSTTIPVDNTKPENTEGAAVAGLDTTITPSAAGSLIEVELSLILSADASVAFRLAVFRDSGADAVYATMQTVGGSDQWVTFRAKFIVAAGSTSATTFKLRAGVGSNNGYINRSNGTAALFNGVAISYMVAKEIKQP